MDSNDIAPNKPLPPEADYMRESISAYKLLNTTLIRILAQPESVEPYLGMLRGIENMLANHTSAIYYVCAGTAQATSIASTGDMLKYADRVQDFANSLQQSTVDSSLWLQTPDLSIKAVRIDGDVEEEFALLALVFDNANTQEIAASEFLKILTEGFSDIFHATRQAQVNRRRDLQKERATISRELHDSLAQSLTYLKIQASRMQLMLRQEHPTTGYKRSEVEAVVRELRDNLNIAYRQLRELMTTFRLTVNSKDFAQAIEDSVGEFAKRSRIVFSLDNRLGNEELTVDEEMQVLHIVREALSNIVRHSHARRAKVALHHLNKNIRLTISDDGVGIDKLQRRAQHLGLIIMQERSRNLGGEFSVREQTGGGTEIRVTFTPQKSTAAKHQQQLLMV